MEKMKKAQSEAQPVTEVSYEEDFNKEASIKESSIKEASGIGAVDLSYN